MRAQPNLPGLHYLDKRSNPNKFLEKTPSYTSCVRRCFFCITLHAVSSKINSSHERLDETWFNLGGVL